MCFTLTNNSSFVQTKLNSLDLSAPVGSALSVISTSGALIRFSSFDSIKPDTFHCVSSRDGYRYPMRSKAFDISAPYF